MKFTAKFAFTKLAVLSSACMGAGLDGSTDALDLGPDAAFEEEYLGNATFGTAAEYGPTETAFASTSCAYTGDPRPLLLGGLRATTSVLTQNMFGKHNTGPLCNSGGDYCSERLRMGGRLIANTTTNVGFAFDVVGVQEVNENQTCSCGGENFVEGIQVNGEFGNFRDGYPKTGRNGGVGVFSSLAITGFDWRGTDNGTGNHSSGHIFAEIEVDSSLSVDYYVVHLKSGNDADDISQRNTELQSLRDNIAEHSASSGNPVIVMGDFNIGGLNMDGLGGDSCEGNDGYEDIMQILGSPRDLWLEAHGTDGTEGATVDGASNSLTSSSDHKRIDFIFAITDPGLTNSAYDVILPSPESVHRFTGRVVVENQLITPMSDHWGVAATLEFRQKVSFPAVVAAVL